MTDTGLDRSPIVMKPLLTGYSQKPGLRDLRLPSACWTTVAFRPVAWLVSAVILVIVGGASCPAQDMRPVEIAVQDGARDGASVVNHAVDLAHAECYVNDPFPSAAKCGSCHPRQYREWSVSPHAYAQLSPVFNAFSNTIIKLTNGTNGDFCIRCHTPVGMALEEPINISQMDRHPTSREGVTCVVCHRINQAWGKGAGRQALVTGDIHQPVYGPSGGETLAHVLANPHEYGVLKTQPDAGVRGRDIHQQAVRFFQLTKPGFCGSCHDVFSPTGFRLEDAFSEYKHSPAARKLGQSCQDCHMGEVPGEPGTYACVPAARVGNIETPPRKHANHMIVGPDHSVIHPGLFPHNPRAVRNVDDPPEADGLATMREWLQFDIQAGWGTEEFEDRLPGHVIFPEAWNSPVRRYQAREILNDQRALLAEADRRRWLLLRKGYQLSAIELLQADRRGMRFAVDVVNGTDGHGVPTGFDAERVVFLRVLVWDRTGKVIYQSGDLDPNGDLRDGHSAFVHNGLIPRDRDLLSLQTKFITRNVRGGEREQIINVPFSLDPLPYIRPEIRPFTVLGRPSDARKHKQNVEVGGRRRGVYTVSANRFTGQGPYYVRVQLIAGMVPVNLVHAVSKVGFDFGMSAQQVADAIVAGHLVLHEQCVQIAIE